MKRLLEWKQRMLQSPLTRKGMQQGGSNMSAMSKLGSNPNILLASTTVASGAHYVAPNAGGGNSSGTAVGGGAGRVGVATGIVGGSSGGTSSSLVGGVGGIQRSQSEVHANLGPAGYNSYSSDDEGMCELSNYIHIHLLQLSLFLTLTASICLSLRHRKEFTFMVSHRHFWFEDLGLCA